MSSAQETLARRLRTQARSCAELGSPLYADLMERAAANVEAGGPVFEVLADHADDPGPSAIALRLFGGVHRLALVGRAPDLAAYYPSCAGGTGGATGDAWPAFLATVTAHQDELRAGLDQAPQTNEVGRSAALMPGFVVIGAETGLPLRLLELGASAGLNLRWDQYRYEIADPPLGDPGSAVRFPPSWYEDTGDLANGPWPEVLDRRGCDRSPIDPTTTEGRTTLLSYLWPDQTERIERLRAALDIAARVPVALTRADAAEWLEEQLAAPPPRQPVTTVVFHSIFVQYLSQAQRDRLRTAIEAAGQRATAEAPLAWLTMEPGSERRAELRLRTWPGGADRVLGTCGFHGPVIQLVDQKVGAGGVSRP